MRAPQIGEFNLYGRPSKGRENELKFALDQHKVSILKEFIENHAPHGLDKTEVWSSCVDAIHKKILSMKENK